MNIYIETRVLKSAVSKAASIIDLKACLPVLRCIRLKAWGNEVVVSATNLDQHVSLTVTPDSVSSEGAAVVDARLLARVLGKIKSKTVIVAAGKNSLTITGEGEYEFMLPMEEKNIEGFPTMPDMVRSKARLLSVSQALLLQSMSRSAVFMSQDVTRPPLVGVNWEFGHKDKVDVAATDGRTLCKSRLDIKMIQEGETKNANSIIIPALAVKLLCKVLDKDEVSVSVSVHGNMVMFEREGCLMTSKLVDAIYPNYRMVLPTERDYWVTVNRGDLIRFLKTARSFYNVGTSVHMQSLDEMQRVTLTGKFGNVELTGVCEAGFSRGDMVNRKTAFNPVLMLRAVNFFDRDTLAMSFPYMEPIMFGDKENYCVIMPMRTPEDC